MDDAAAQRQGRDKKHDVRIPHAGTINAGTPDTNDKLDSHFSKFPSMSARVVRLLRSRCSQRHKMEPGDQGDRRACRLYAANGAYLMRNSAASAA